jgi:hypothetical protein
MMRYAGKLYRPILSMLGKAESLRVPMIYTGILETISVVAEIFPNIVAHSFTLGRCESYFIERLNADIDAITNSKMQFVENINGRKTEERLLLFAVCEKLLLHCSRVLPATVRDTIEHCIGRALFCLSKGVLSVQLADRRGSRMAQLQQQSSGSAVNQSQSATSAAVVGSSSSTFATGAHGNHASSMPPEIIRYCSRSQVLLLRMALADILSPSSRQGLLSSNIVVLKRTCEVCKNKNECVKYD